MWTDGYFTEGTYTYGYYRELSPVWQRFCLLVNGYEVPAPDRDNVHCELGFGQGISVNIHAATAQGNFIGTDFNPSHALHANLLCKASGTNAKLYDLSFAELMDEPDMPMLDSISMHGVWTWISHENQKKVVEFIRRYLKPGGIFYNSYNCFPGWAQHHPIRELLTMPDIYIRSGNNAAARVTNALAFAKEAVTANPLYAERNADLLERLKDLQTKNPNYLAHEYLNRDWNVMYFTEVAEMLKEAKLDYACTASLLDTLDDVESMNLPQEATAFLSTISHPLLREELRDYYINRQFRKDLYVKGTRRLTPAQQLKGILSIRYILLVMDLKHLECSGYYRKIDFKSELVEPVVAWLKTGGNKPKDFTGYLAAHPETAPEVVCSLLKVMVEQGVIAPCQSEEAAQEAKPACDRLNRYLCQRALAADEIFYLASPVTGSGVNLNRIAQMVLHFMWQGVKENALPKEVWKTLDSQGQFLLKDGKKLETEKENLAELKLQVKGFTEQTLPVLTRLGIL